MSLFFKRLNQLFGHHLSADETWWYTGPGHGKLAGIKKVGYFLTPAGWFENGGLQKGIGKPVSIALVRIVFTCKVGDGKGFFENDGAGKALSCVLLQPL